MSIVGIGTDIVDVTRVEEILARHGERFARRLLGAREYQGFLATNRPAGLLARRLAAKEAAAKALGTGIAAGVTFTDLEVVHDPRGRPALELHGVAAERMRALGASRSHLSISDERGYAVAFVVLEGGAD